MSSEILINLVSNKPEQPDDKNPFLTERLHNKAIEKKSNPVLTPKSLMNKHRQKSGGQNQFQNATNSGIVPRTNEDLNFYDDTRIKRKSALKSSKNNETPLPNTAQTQQRKKSKPIWQKHTARSQANQISQNKIDQLKEQIVQSEIKSPRRSICQALPQTLFDAPIDHQGKKQIQKAYQKQKKMQNNSVFLNLRPNSNNPQIDLFEVSNKLDEEFERDDLGEIEQIGVEKGKNLDEVFVNSADGPEKGIQKFIDDDIAQQLKYTINSGKNALKSQQKNRKELEMQYLNQKVKLNSYHFSKQKNSKENQYKNVQGDQFENQDNQKANDIPQGQFRPQRKQSKRQSTKNNQLTVRGSSPYRNFHQTNRDDVSDTNNPRRSIFSSVGVSPKLFQIDQNSLGLGLKQGQPSKQKAINYLQQNRGEIVEGRNQVIDQNKNNRSIYLKSGSPNDNDPNDTTLLLQQTTIDKSFMDGLSSIDLQNSLKIIRQDENLQIAQKNSGQIQRTFDFQRKSPQFVKQRLSPGSRNRYKKISKSGNKISIVADIKQTISANVTNDEEVQNNTSIQGLPNTAWRNTETPQLNDQIMTAQITASVSPAHAPLNLQQKYDKSSNLAENDHQIKVIKSNVKSSPLTPALRQMGRIVQSSNTQNRRTHSKFSSQESSKMQDPLKTFQDSFCEFQEVQEESLRARNSNQRGQIKNQIKKNQQVAAHAEINQQKPTKTANSNQNFTKKRQSLQGTYKALVIRNFNQQVISSGFSGHPQTTTNTTQSINLSSPTNFLDNSNLSLPHKFIRPLVTSQNQRKKLKRITGFNSKDKQSIYQKQAADMLKHQSKGFQFQKQQNRYKNNEEQPRYLENLNQSFENMPQSSLKPAMVDLILNPKKRENNILTDRQYTDRNGETLQSERENLHPPNLLLNDNVQFTIMNRSQMEDLKAPNSQSKTNQTGGVKSGKKRSISPQQNQAFKKSEDQSDFGGVTSKENNELFVMMENFSDTENKQSSQRKDTITMVHPGSKISHFVNPQDKLSSTAEDQIKQIFEENHMIVDYNNDDRKQNMMNLGERGGFNVGEAIIEGGIDQIEKEEGAEVMSKAFCNSFERYSTVEQERKQHFTRQQQRARGADQSTFNKMHQQGTLVTISTIQRPHIKTRKIKTSNTKVRQHRMISPSELQQHLNGENSGSKNSQNDEDEDDQSLKIEFNENMNSHGGGCGAGRGANQNQQFGNQSVKNRAKSSNADQKSATESSRLAFVKSLQTKMEKEVQQAQKVAAKKDQISTLPKQNPIKINEKPFYVRKGSKVNKQEEKLKQRQFINLDVTRIFDDGPPQKLLHLLNSPQSESNTDIPPKFFTLTDSQEVKTRDQMLKQLAQNTSEQTQTDEVAAAQGSKSINIVLVKGDQETMKLEDSLHVTAMTDHGNLHESILQEEKSSIKSIAQFDALSPMKNNYPQGAKLNQMKSRQKLRKRLSDMQVIQSRFKKLDVQNNCGSGEGEGLQNQDLINVPFEMTNQRVRNSTGFNQNVFQTILQMPQQQRELLIQQNQLLQQNQTGETSLQTFSPGKQQAKQLALSNEKVNTSQVKEDQGEELVDDSTGKRTRGVDQFIEANQSIISSPNKSQFQQNTFDGKLSLQSAFKENLRPNQLLKKPMTAQHDGSLTSRAAYDARKRLQHESNKSPMERYLEHKAQMRQERDLLLTRNLKATIEPSSLADTGKVAFKLKQKESAFDLQKKLLQQKRGRYQNQRHKLQTADDVGQRHTFWTPRQQVFSPTDNLNETVQIYKETKDEGLTKERKKQRITETHIQNNRHLRRQVLQSVRMKALSFDSQVGGPITSDDLKKTKRFTFDKPITRDLNACQRIQQGDNFGNKVYANQ